MNRTTFIVRLTRKSDGKSGFGEIETPMDPATVLLAAYEQYGLTHHVGHIYPKEHVLRFDWPPHAIAAASVAPV